MRARSFIFLLLAVFGLALGWLNTQTGRDFLLGQIIKSIESSGTQVIRYEKAEGFVPFYFKISNLVLAQKNRDTKTEEKWLEVEEARVWILPLDLLWKKLTIPNLVLKNAILYDSPHGSGNYSQLPYPKHHFLISIEEFTIKNFEVKNQVFPWMKKEIESLQTNASGKAFFDITNEEMVVETNFFDSLGNSKLLYYKNHEFDPNREMDLYVEESGQGLLSRSFDITPNANLKATAKFLKHKTENTLEMPLNLEIGNRLSASGKFVFGDETIAIDQIKALWGDEPDQRVKGSLLINNKKEIEHGEFYYDEAVASVSGPIDDLKIDLQGFYHGIDLTGVVKWNGSQATAVFPKLEVTGKIDWAGKEEKPFEIKFKNRLIVNGALRGDDWVIKKVEGTLGGEQITLKEEVILTGETLSKTSIQVGRGLGTLDYDFRGKTPIFHLKLENFPLQPLHELMPSIAPSGIVSGSAEYEGNKGAVFLTMDKIQIDEDNQPISGKITGAFIDRELKLEGKLQGLSEQPILAGITLPIEYRPGRGVVIPMNQPIKGVLKGKGEIEPFLSLIHNGAHKIKGEVSVDLTVDGTLDRPEFKGTIDFANGKYESYTYGTIIQNVMARGVAEGNKLKLVEIKGDGGHGGKAFGSGEIEFNIRKNFPFKAQLELEKMVLLDIDYAKVGAEGNLVFEGDFRKGSLNGDLRITSGDVKIPNRMPEGIKTVDVEYINIPVGEVVEVYQPAVYPIDLQVRLVVPSNLSVTGRGLSSTWKGEVKVEGTTIEPEVYGKLSIAKGDFQLGSKVFKINEGVLTFNGEVPDDVQITAGATVDVNGVSITALLSGDAVSPDLSFSSTPSMATRDIFSYILFGKNASEISKFQTIQLAQTAMSMGSGGMDFMGNLRKGFKLDRLEIGGTEDDLTDMTLEVGKYINKWLFISMSKSIHNDGAKIGLEAELRKGLSLQAEIDRERQTDLLLKWKRYY